jgi:hypothetical protein
VSAKVPTRDLEQSLHDAGHRIIVGVDVAYDIVAFDPQTSGGLLAAVDQSAVAGLTAPGSPFLVIGNVVAGTPGLRLV